MKKALFIDRDGTLVREPADEQVDSFEKLEFMPHVFSSLALIQDKTDFDLIVVSNQDGLGTPAYPQVTFDKIQHFIEQAFRNEGITFKAWHFDSSTSKHPSANRKPAAGMLKPYLDGSYDMSHSYVIGDRETDMQLARNLGCKAYKLTEDFGWPQISDAIVAGERKAEIRRQTKETDVYVSLDLNGTGKAQISTGLGFFDHMLEQIARHGEIDLTIETKGDLQVDEHHTIEDTAIVLGQCLRQALGDKRGIERYGFCLPMDDCLCQVAIDFGGRPWLVWQADFKREKIGEMPTEMFFHFFKSLSDAAKMNLNIKAEGQNEHHKIEGIFKAWARSLKMAVRRDITHFQLPSSKGVL